MKRQLADAAIVILRFFRLYRCKYAVIRWGYGEQATHAWDRP